MQLAADTGATILLSSHIVADLERVCDRTHTGLTRCR